MIVKVLELKLKEQESIVKEMATVVDNDGHIEVEEEEVVEEVEEAIVITMEAEEEEATCKNGVAIIQIKAVITLQEVG